MTRIGSPISRAGLSHGGDKVRPKFPILVLANSANPRTSTTAARIAAVRPSNLPGNGCGKGRLGGNVSDGEPEEFSRIARLWRQARSEVGLARWKAVLLLALPMGGLLLGAGEAVIHAREV
jgi:hypothetical protein